MRFEDLPLRDVEGDADHAQRHAGGIVPHLGRGLEVSGFPICQDDAEFGIKHGSAGHRERELPLHTRAIVAMKAAGPLLEWLRACRAHPIEQTARLVIGVKRTVEQRPFPHSESRGIAGEREAVRNAFRFRAALLQIGRTLGDHGLEFRLLRQVARMLGVVQFAQFPEGAAQLGTHLVDRARQHADFVAGTVVDHGLVEIAVRYARGHVDDSRQAAGQAPGDGNRQRQCDQ